ncbi:MAG: Holliday junction branch migration protein RuvA [bacterium]
MIHFLCGDVAEVQEGMVVLDVGGVGYRVFVPTSVAGAVRKGDRSILLHTVLIVADSDMSLYGFLTTEERDIFNLLLRVSGIGPKVAVKLLSLPKGTLVEAISAEDAAMLTTIPGVGSKTAKRVILELKEKVSALYGEPGVQRAFPPEMAGEVEIAAQGLHSLGYSYAEIRRMLREIPGEELKGKGAPEIIKLCLRRRR